MLAFGRGHEYAFHGVLRCVGKNAPEFRDLDNVDPVVSDPNDDAGDVKEARRKIEDCSIHRRRTVGLKGRRCVEVRGINEPPNASAGGA